MIGLPDGWREEALSDAAHIVMGQSPSGSSFNSEGQGRPFFQGKADFGKSVAKVRVFTTAGTKLAAEGDILLSVRAPVGPTNICPTAAVIGRGLAAIRARDHVDQRYLHWAITATVSSLIEKAMGTTFAAVTAPKLRTHVVRIAPFPEQRRIVDILEDQLSRLDAADAGLARSARLTAVLRSATIARVAEGAGAEVSTLAELSHDAGYGTSENVLLGELVLQ